MLRATDAGPSFRSVDSSVGCSGGSGSEPHSSSNTRVEACSSLRVWSMKSKPFFSQVRMTLLKMLWAVEPSGLRLQSLVLRMMTAARNSRSAA